MVSPVQDVQELTIHDDTRRNEMSNISLGAVELSRFRSAPTEIHNGWYGCLSR